MRAEDLPRRDRYHTPVTGRCQKFQKFSNDNFCDLPRRCMVMGTAKPRRGRIAPLSEGAGFNGSTEDRTRSEQDGRSKKEFVQTRRVSDLENNDTSRVDGSVACFGFPRRADSRPITEQRFVIITRNRYSTGPSFRSIKRNALRQRNRAK